MKKITLILPLILLVAMLGCFGGDDGPTTTTPDLTEAEADSTAAAGFDALMAELDGLDWNDPSSIQNMDLDAAKAGFRAVLDDYPNHPLANLGMAAVLTVEVGADDTIWTAIDDLYNEMNPERSPRALDMVGNPLEQVIQLVTEGPLLMATMSRDFPVALTAPMLQRYIHDSVIPVVDQIIEHIQNVENNADFNLEFTIDEQTLEIDLGEIYVLDALVQGLRAGLRMTLPYDLDIAHPTLGYDWLLELGEDDEFNVEVVPGGVEGDTLFVEHIERVTSEVLLFETMNHQLAPASDFLTLRTSPYNGANQLELAHDGLLDMLVTLETAVAYILNEEDSQEDDIIQIELLELLNAGIAECGDTGGCPEEWQDIQSVIDWIEVLLTEPVEIPLDLGPSDPRARNTITIDIAAFFDGGVPDWKALLPYHAWHPQENWVDTDSYVDDWWPGSGIVEVWDNVNDEWVLYSNIEYIHEYHYFEFLNGPPFELLDGPGGDPIDPGGVFPYFPDYTFGGIFPLMDRAAWELLWMGDPE